MVCERICLSLLVCIITNTLLTTGAIAIRDESFSENLAPLLLSNVNCSGNETALLECQYNTPPNYYCDRLEDAGVVCQGMQCYP